MILNKRSSLLVPLHLYVVEQVKKLFRNLVLKTALNVLSLSEGQTKHLGKDGKCMTNRCKVGTTDYSSQELNRELSDVLIAISVVSRRIADRISIVSGREKLNTEGGCQNGKDKRIVHARS